MQPVRWSAEDGLKPIVFSDGVARNGHASKVSADGRTIAGWMNRTSDEPSAFLWDGVNGARWLSDLLIEQGVDLQGWQPVTAQSISPKGRYVVGSVGGHGVQHVYLVDLGPRHAPGDANGADVPGGTNDDGTVDLGDLNDVRNNFGAGSANPIPEPSSLFQLALGSFGILARRRAARRWSL